MTYYDFYLCYLEFLLEDGCSQKMHILRGPVGNKTVKNAQI